jgi:hypothetical protein
LKPDAISSTRIAVRDVTSGARVCPVNAGLFSGTFGDPWRRAAKASNATSVRTRDSTTM